LLLHQMLQLLPGKIAAVCVVVATLRLLFVYKAPEVLGALDPAVVRTKRIKRQRRLA